MRACSVCCILHDARRPAALNTCTHPSHGHWAAQDGRATPRSREADLGCTLCVTPCCMLHVACCVLHVVCCMLYARSMRERRFAHAVWHACAWGGLGSVLGRGDAQMARRSYMLWCCCKSRQCGNAKSNRHLLDRLRCCVACLQWCTSVLLHVFYNVARLYCCTSIINVASLL